MPTITRGLLTTTALTNVGLVSAGLIMASSAAMANPVGGSVVNGSASISSSGNTLTVNQATANTTINWSSFSIAPTETTNFVQPSSSSIAFNRVTGVNPSQIEGHLNANGQVVLVNPNGVLFTKTAQVNVGGLVATTSDFSNSDAAQGKFTGTGNRKSGVSVENDGSIVSTAGANGLTALVSPTVVNNGVITATLGKVHLSAGDAWAVDLYGDKLVTFAVNNKFAAQVTNNGQVSAAQVNMTANAAKGIVGNAINMAGVVEASAVVSDGNAIVLAAPTGTVSISGKLSTTGATGGAISVSGDTVVMNGATISAAGAQGGGTVAVAATTNLMADAATSIDASATTNGNGGTVSLASTGSATYAGSVATRGGASAGNGGTVVAAGQAMNATGMSVDASAAKGATGTFTFNSSSDTVDAAEAAILEKNIGTTNEVVVGNNLTVVSAVSLASPNSLTFSAFGNVSVNAGVVNTGAGNLMVRADNAGNGVGLISFGNDAAFQTNGAVSLYSHPVSYTAPAIAGAGANVHGVAGTTEYMLVDNAADLANVNSNLAGTYALGNNISNVGSIAPIGNAATPFSGVFDGFGGIATYTLGGVSVTALTDAGLFGNNSGTIRNVSVNGLTVSGNSDVGGLVGYNSGTLTNDSIANVSVTGYSATSAVNAFGSVANNVGGLVGYNTTTGVINGINVQGSVFVDWNSLYEGGVIGSNYGVISNAGFQGTVTAGCNEIGGFVGANYGTITDSTTDAVVTNMGGGQTGGFAGLNGSKVVNGVTMTGNLSNDSANAQVIVGANNFEVGGFVGTNQNGALINADSVFGTIAVTDNSTAIGGFAGDNLAGTIQNSVSNINLSVGNHVTDAGNLAGANSGVLLNNTVSGDSLTAGSYAMNVGGYLGVNLAGGAVNGAYGNGNVSGNSGSSSVVGSVSGDVGPGAPGVYTGAYSTNVGGYIGWEQSGTISGVSLVSTVVSGDFSQNVGGLVGFNHGNLINDKVQANVQSGSMSGSVGGMVGLNSGTIEGAGVTGLVNVFGNTSFAGGVIGANYGQVSGSSFGGTVNAGCDEIGGFVGGNFASIVDSTASGLVINGGGIRMGGFAGQNYGTLTNDAATASSVVAAAGMQYVGGFVGANESTGVVTNSAFSGTVTSGVGPVNGGGYDIGGFAGINVGHIVDSSAVSTILGGNGNHNIGGFAGENDGIISNGTAQSNISVASNAISIGGFVGGNNAGTVTNATASGTILANIAQAVSATVQNIGGLIGWNGATLNGGTYNGTIQAGGNAMAVGGAVGKNATGAQVSNASATANVTVGDNANYVGGGLGWNDAGASASDIAFSGSVVAGNNASGVGGIAGLNGSDATNDRGSFATASAVLNSGTFNGTVSVGTNGFAVGGLVGWNSAWTAGNKGSGTTYYGSIADGHDATLTNVAVSGTGSVSGSTGTTYIHNANQNGCDERAGGNCFGIAGQEIITVDANNVNLTYGQAAPASLTYSLAGLAPGNATSITQGDVLESYDLPSNVISGQLSSNATQNAGTYQINQGTLGLNASNANALLDYKLVFNTNTGTYTVNKAQLTVTANGQQTYGDTTPSVSYSYAACSTASREARW